MLRFEDVKDIVAKRLYEKFKEGHFPGEEKVTLTSYFSTFEFYSYIKMDVDFAEKKIVSLPKSDYHIICLQIKGETTKRLYPIPLWEIISNEEARKIAFPKVSLLKRMFKK